MKCAPVKQKTQRFHGVNFARHLVNFTVQADDRGREQKADDGRQTTEEIILATESLQEFIIIQLTKNTKFTKRKIEWWELLR